MPQNALFGMSNAGPQIAAIDRSRLVVIPATFWINSAHRPEILVASETPKAQPHIFRTTAQERKTHRIAQSPSIS
jgi:hypothetical protein